MFVKPSTWATSLRQLYLNKWAPHTSCLGTNLPKPMQNTLSGCSGSLQPYACMQQHTVEDRPTCVVQLSLHGNKVFQGIRESRT